MIKLTEPVHDQTPRMRDAFHWISAQQVLAPCSSARSLVEEATARFELSEHQATWLLWSLDPRSVALPSKEPQP